MPYTIVPDGDQFYVHKKLPDGNAGKRIACHDTRGEAQAQIAAIEADENKTIIEKATDLFNAIKGYGVTEDFVEIFADLGQRVFVEFKSKQNENAAFVSIPLPRNPDVKGIQADIISQLGEENLELQEPETFHVTLLYTPNVDDETLEDIAENLKIGKVDIVGEELGVFENDGERALHIALKKSESLMELQRHIMLAFEERGVEISEYSKNDAYKPHITVAYMQAGIMPEAVKCDNLDLKTDAVTITRNDYEPFAIFEDSRRKIAAISKAKGLRKAIIITSNAYIDREREIITEAALKEDTDRRWKDGEFVDGDPLLLWHDGEPIGDIIFADMHGPFLIEVARERPDAQVNLAADGEPPINMSIKAVWDALENMENLGASHAFKYPLEDREDGVYEDIVKRETSVLPRNKAANIFTDFEIVRN